MCGAPGRRFGRPAATVLGMRAALHRVELVEGILVAECRVLTPEVAGFE